MKPSKKPNPVLPLTLLVLLLLALSLTGCGHCLPAPPGPSPELPTTPLLATPLPSVTYSESVKLQLLDWQKSLQATPLMSKP